MKARLVIIAVVVGVAAARVGVRGQQPPPRPARAVAPIELTGYWVSVVTEDWRWRMLTPKAGDVQSVPLNGEGVRVARAWDLAKDEASGNACKAFGVGGIMRQPGRLHITWQDDNTLKIETDAGTQTRLLHFDRAAAPPTERSWQGFSRAEWQVPPGAGRVARPGANTPFSPTVPGGGGSGLRGGPPPTASLNEGGSLRVETSMFREGYLRKNGVPYSENASIVENFDRLPPHPNGDVWLLVVTTVDDPKYLSQPFYTSTHFKREPDGSKWNPTPCHTDPPPK